MEQEASIVGISFTSACTCFTGQPTSPPQHHTTGFLVFLVWVYRIHCCTNTGFKWSINQRWWWGKAALWWRSTALSRHISHSSLYLPAHKYPKDTRRVGRTGCQCFCEWRHERERERERDACLVPLGDSKQSQTKSRQPNSHGHALNTLTFTSYCEASMINTNTWYNGMTLGGRSIQCNNTFFLPPLLPPAQEWTQWNGEAI